MSNQIDAQKLIRNTGREIKCISYHLSTVISNGEVHYEVFNMQPNLVEIIESTPIYVKIPCKGMLSPCRIKFDYQSKGDVKIYMS